MGHCPPFLGKEMSLSQLLSLSSVLYVPNFATNLLSISRSCDLNYLITFSLSHYVFQDLDSKQMIGSDRVVDGLYLPDDSVDPQFSTSCVSCSHESF